MTLLVIDAGGRTPELLLGRAIAIGDFLAIAKYRQDRPP